MQITVHLNPVIQILIFMMCSVQMILLLLLFYGKETLINLTRISILCQKAVEGVYLLSLSAKLMTERHESLLA